MLLTLMVGNPYDKDKTGNYILEYGENEEPVTMEKTNWKTVVCTKVKFEAKNTKENIPQTIAITASNHFHAETQKQAEK